MMMRHSVTAIAVLAATAQAAFDTTNNKVTVSNSLAADKLLLYTKGEGGTAQTPLTDTTVYVVASPTANDFQLKAAAPTTLAADGDVISLGTTDAGTYQNRFQLVGATKCIVKSSDQATNKISTKATCTLTADAAMIIYCTGTAAECKLDTADNAKLNGSGLQIQPMTDGDAANGLQFATSTDSDTAITIAGSVATAGTDANPIWLLTKDATSIEPVTTAAPSSSSSGSRGVYALSVLGAVVSYILA